MEWVIEMVNLSKWGQEGTLEVEALRSLCLQVDKGEFVSIMEVSDSGKSTMMNILGCLDKPNAGDYSLERLDISKAKDSRLAEIRACFKTS